ncbi:MAG: diguanylate cyclase [Xanthomonadaceae bacterium]|jgi:diguanylate cyclase (GGDEF)-like protein|nr:diguanylate cyclase [Xanthomonadaceae bacterium]
MSELSFRQLQSAVVQIDRAFAIHEDWTRDVIRTFVVKQPPRASDLVPGAHRRCGFGQWYYSEAMNALCDHAAFVAVGWVHERMHEAAARLLQCVVDGMPIVAAELDELIDLIDRLRLEIRSLRQELDEKTQNRDPLTGALNRARLFPYLREQQTLMRRRAQPCTLAMIDLDHFKRVNDRHGHVAGDIVLASTVQGVQALLRPYDHLYRYGGEEFLLCLPGIAVDAALGLGDRLRAAVAAQPIRTGGSDPPLRITASFGLAALDPAGPVEESVERADKAMYRAKMKGRDRVEAWT